VAEPSGITLPHTDGHGRARRAGPVEAQLFLVLQCDQPLQPSARYSLGHVDLVNIGRGPRQSERLEETAVRRLEVRVPDRWMSGTHASLTRVLGRWVLEDRGSKNGTLLNGTATARGELQDGDLLELGHSFFLFRDAVPATTGESPDLSATDLRAPAPGLVTLAAPLAQQFGLLAQVAASTVSVVIRGDSGTGKELIARAVHRLSGRGGAFVAVNCGSLPETLVETELFGYRKGAFSGANEDRPGLIRSADRGTLFLDEIGDLPPSSQAAFLRALQEQEVTPVGATKPVPVDFRLCAATHRDLEQLVARNEFRGDLFARISGFTVTLPPLRERREDLGIIIGTLLRRLHPDRAEQVAFSCDAARSLFAHEWPLNVRELEKALQAAVVLAGDEPVAPWHLPEAVRAAGLEPSSASGGVKPLSDEDRALKGELEQLLREHKGNISAVARAMGKARMQIQRWVKRFALDPASFR
jgi:transcriptional regulator with GAF, ATPase, and Fis domain